MPGWQAIVGEVLRYLVEAWRGSESRSRERMETELLRLRPDREQRAAGVAEPIEVPIENAVGAMGRCVIVLGGQDTGKSYLSGVIQRVRGSGRPLVWVEEFGSRKETSCPEWGERVPELPTALPKGCDVVHDDGWTVLEHGRARAGGLDWLRRLSHDDRRLVISSQSGRFLEPAVWESGAVQVVHTGYGAGGAVGLEREELRERIEALGLLAIPRARASMRSPPATKGLTGLWCSVSRWRPSRKPVREGR